MDLPKPIRVGPYMITFRELTEEVKDEVEEEVYGFFSMDKESIFLDPDLENRPTLFVEVVFHEVQHAINEVYGVSEDTHTEEKMVTQGARGWAQVVKDNPEFWDWIKLRKMH